MDPHGHYILEIKDNYIFIKYIGSINELTAKKLYDEFMQIENKPESNLKVLIDSTEFEGATPECFNYTRKINKWQNENGIVGKAIIADNSFIPGLVNANGEYLAVQNTKVFSNKSDALQWLESL